MSLHPIRSSRRSRKQRGAYRSFRTKQQWKPWKGWTGEKIKKEGFELFGRKAFVLLLIGLIASVSLGIMYANPNNSLFHSTTPTSQGNDPDIVSQIYAANGAGGGEVV